MAIYIISIYISLFGSKPNALHPKLGVDTHHLLIGEGPLETTPYMFFALRSCRKSGSHMTLEKAKRAAAGNAVEVNIQVYSGSIYENSVHEIVPNRQQAIDKCGII
jgi:hypothetical protein